MFFGRSRPKDELIIWAKLFPDDNGKSNVDVTTDFQAFGLIVTAEPYFSVTRPSNQMVAENIIRQETKGFEEAIDAKFDMLEGGQYTIDMPARQLPSATADPKTPLTFWKPATPWPSQRRPGS